MKKLKTQTNKIISDDLAKELLHFLRGVEEGGVNIVIRPVRLNKSLWHDLISKVHFNKLE